MPIAAVNPWLYRPRWFYNPFIVPGSVLTYNVVPYPSSVTIAPASIVHETVLAPQAKAYHSPPKYSSNSPPPISHTAVAVKPQSHEETTVCLADDSRIVETYHNCFDKETQPAI
ncbi:hypothetical protein C368_04770 [Cryptococcus neoformans 125.91]|nr:hypothetical protein C368_04770 [Cryptococcus neoformans var. grubii 125.91]OXG38347.1 hypothetical protein C359_04345 [Cryptococcus neoformans var. grubii Bt120]